MAIPLSEIEDARSRIRGHVHETPVMTCSGIDELLGDNRRLFFKCEHLQKVGAFKIRGALNALSALRTKPSSVVTHSSGNHAQAIALAGRILGIPAHIVMPSTSPAVKRAAVEKSYNATVYLCEPTLKARDEKAAEVVAKTGGVFIHPYDNPMVQAGQGTCGYEFHFQTFNMGAPLDAVVVAIGGGGMFAGMASALKALNPNVKVYAAEPLEADDASRGFESGRVEEHRLGRPGNTLADGLLTLLSDSTHKAMVELADGVITVTEQEIARALRLVFERMKQVIEPSAAVPLAAALSDKFPKDPSIRNIGIVLCGGNLDLNLIPEILRRESKL